jgi:hypothetical protein
VQTAKAPAANVQGAAVAPEVRPSAEQIYWEIARKLAIFTSDWRRCPRKICRRSRACRLPDAECFSPRQSNRAPLTDDQWEREKIALKRALENRLAEIGGEGA